ncbi:hypothetical protein QW060_19690 [Myroides ceti]|uniref:DUF6705 domain-containing protein n=1 Tax=Paenimyroides ceti TaxID=395087 RepID=A0ABT8CXK3_9FLAO|nr:DUF6705 family protein [Paenimyroides ceti]MDN3707440.1 hypothetical protein [Paenimyroides ceti]MDN3709247.1 hypothetical protein [Paenimyroides ceti]
MKTIFFIVTLLITQVSIAQQFTVMDVHNYSGMNSYGENGYYYKDTQGYFDQFTGADIWQYTANNIIIQLRFVKKTFIEKTIGNTYKEDALIGGMRIIENGVEVLNTLNTLNENKNSSVNYFIYDGYRVRNTIDCLGCTIPDQRLYMHYKEPDNDNNHLASMYFLMHVYKNGSSSILRVVFPEDAVIGDPTQYDPEVENAPTKTQVIFPFGKYDFKKVN